MARLGRRGGAITGAWPVDRSARVRRRASAVARGAGVNDASVIPATTCPPWGAAAAGAGTTASTRGRTEAPGGSRSARATARTRSATTAWAHAAPGAAAGQTRTAAIRTRVRKATIERTRARAGASGRSFPRDLCGIRSPARRGQG